MRRVPYSPELSNTPRFATETERPAVLRVPRPIDVFPLQSTVGTVFTARDDADFQIESLVAANVTATADSVTVHFVPSGDTAGAANTIAFEVEVPANDRLVIFDRERMAMLQPGMALQALCATSDAINLYGFGYDYQGQYAG